MQVTLKPSDSISFVPHPVHDGGTYSSRDLFMSRVNGEGYSGGVRLLKAMCKILFQDCEQRGLRLPQQHFELSYETNIPRQSGLSGSSAIACAAFNCLLAFYSLGDRCAQQHIMYPGLVTCVCRFLSTIAPGQRDHHNIPKALRLSSV